MIAASLGDQKLKRAVSISFATIVDQRTHDGAGFLQRARIGNVENFRGAKPDNRQRLAGRRDRTRNRR
jgi:hypothetical protein